MSYKKITPKETKIDVSSTFDRNSAKTNLLDGNNETCWSSAQGLPQHLHLSFPRLIPASHIALTFQGGFSSTSIGVYIASQRPGKEVENMELGLVFGGKIYPKDGNGRQVFELPIPEALPDSVHLPGIHPIAIETPTSTPNSTSAPALDASSSFNPQVIDPKAAELAKEKDWIKEIKLEFEKGADPWGRIVVYEVEVLSDYKGEF